MQQGNGVSSGGTEAFKCPDCGAPVTFKPGETQTVCPYCGSSVRMAPEEPSTPVFQPAPYTSAYNPQPVRIPSSVSAPPKRRSIFITLLTTLALIGACIFGIGAFSNIIFRLTGTFDQAMQQASSSAEVKRVFGEPLQPGLFIMGQVETSGNSGSADYDIPIFGPLRSGTLHVSGSLNRSGWHLDLVADYQENGEDMSIEVPPPK